LTGVAEREVERLLDELSQNGVFSRDVKGRIFCRRMVRDTHYEPDCARMARKEVKAAI
jgi:hypothetical protein